ncbi:unnamed protein product [Nesidiocoris tenuis]|uniref:Biogenesis of lysosome-related organelles complex 1 subunit 1 n=1 Tax=Nesidiocoris tenuis TaxID=355587 RepID=A0A6H5G5I4_9HEMI|nr:unnamed protein product [Nesidiocoris tenuis]
MLSSLVKEHHAKQLSKKEAQEGKRKEALTAASSLTQALVDHLNVGVAQAYLNQKRLDAEAKHLHQNAANFAKNTQQWLVLVEGFSNALKELGDVENWAQAIENDMKTITCALEYAYKGKLSTMNRRCRINTAQFVCHAIYGRVICQVATNPSFEK